MDSFSAHGDRREIVNHINNQKSKVKKLFLVHGELDTQKEFSKYLDEHGFEDIVVPYEGQIFKL